MIGASVKVLQTIERDMRRASQGVQKAMSFAVSRAAYTAMSELVKGLKFGRLGLPKKQPLRVRGGKRIRARRSDTRPLANMFKGVIYRKLGFTAVTGAGLLGVTGKSMGAEFGFLGGTDLLDWYRRRAELHLDGYRIPLTDPELRAKKAEMGIHLKKTTTYAQVPARDPVGAYYRANARRLGRIVDDVFTAKMRGERV